MADCSYTFKGPDGNYLTVTGIPALKAYFVDGGLEHLFPERTFPLKAVAAYSREGIGSTINVDGIDRPTTNSDGKLIHPTEDGIRNFWRWFGDSNNVDDSGQPKVWYRGQIGEKAAEDPFSATAIGAPSFADSPRIANMYALNPDAANLYGAGARPEDYSAGGNVSPYYVRGELLDVSSLQGGHGTKSGLTPKNVKAILKLLGLSEKDVYLDDAYSGRWGSGRDAFWDSAEYDTPNSKKIMAAYALFDLPEVHDAVLKSGYSAVRFNGAIADSRKNLDSKLPWDESDVHGELRVVEPTALKSAIGNVGAFSPEEADIRYSKNLPSKDDTFRSQAEAEDHLVQEFGQLS